MKRKWIGPSLVLGGLLSVSMGCAPHADEIEGLTRKNLVEAGNPQTNQQIGDAKNQFTILGTGAFEAKVAAGEVERMESAASLSTSKSLLFGMPSSMLNKPMIFGSVVTQVSDRENEDLGGLKLADLPPFQVVAVYKKTGTRSYSVSIRDCGGDCSKATDSDLLINVPVVGVDSAKKVYYLDLASLGRELDLTAIRKGDSTLENFKSKSSETVKFDFSSGTLVFDVEARLVSRNRLFTEDTSKETVITNRWYLKPQSDLNSRFVSREATPGVGFFMTEKSPEPLVQRWDFDKRKASAGIKYYIKNVPVEHQAAFAGAFEEWNEKLKPVIGKKVFSYEFIQADDPRADLLVTGDVRYNILEWDLVNKAGYGGLGPSLAHQYSGEIFQASVLVQGPMIMDIYTKWFKANESASLLLAEGREKEANELLGKFNRSVKAKVNRLKARTFSMRLGKHLDMKIRSQQPSLEDPLMSKEEFDRVPEGYDFKKYMAGYFHDLVAHEVGHDLGLRHNFRGNLGAADGASSVGGVSRSIMEYLGRGYRHLDRIGEYDVMAVAYGYKGVKPTHTTWFCTDEDVPDFGDDSKSPECTRDDATNDPFSYYEGRLSRVADLLVARGKTWAPQWKLDEIMSYLRVALSGLGNYAVAAEKTSQSWTNFFSQGGRPQRAAEVKSYVLSRIKMILCDPSLKQEASSKADENAKNTALANLSGLRSESQKLLGSIYNESELACIEQ